MATASAGRARKPVILCRAMEELLAAVLARAAWLLAGAVMIRLIRALVATPYRPGRGARAASGWSDGGRGVRQQCAGQAGWPAVSGGEGDVGCTA